MAITRKMDTLAENTVRAHRADRLVEKWSKMPQVGKGIAKMSEAKARNLSILLENQAQYMGQMNEAVMAANFASTTPENLLKLVRIVYPNAIRGDLFTEVAMETANDAITYIEPVYAQDASTAIYEQVTDKTQKAITVVKNDLATEPAEYVAYVDGAIAAVKIGDIATGTAWASLATTAEIVVKGADIHFDESKIDEVGLGEIELRTRKYNFKPRALTLGVTWTMLAELILDSSFKVSAEEMLLDSAAQEIKKAMDYQAIAFAAKCQTVNAATFNAMNEGAPTSGDGKYNGETYWQRAQVVMQAVGKVRNSIYNTLQRGGVSAIVGTPDAIEYFKLHKGFEAKGAQDAFGAYKAGEIDGIALYVAPKSLLGFGEGAEGALTTWKNEAAGVDCSVAIGTLFPLYSTGAIARKGIYKEAGLARFEDMCCLNNKYLGKLTISNLA